MILRYFVVIQSFQKFQVVPEKNNTIDVVQINMQYYVECQYNLK